MLTSPHVDTTVAVLLLKMGEYVIHHGAVGIARSLGRLGVPVYAMVEDRYTPLAMCRHLTGAFVNRTEDTNGLLNYLGAIGEHINRRTILLPTDDNGAVFIAEHAKELSHWFLFPHLPAEVPRQLVDKMSLYSLCRGVGIPCPEHALPTSIDQVHEFIGRATFPVVVKAAEHSRRLNNGSSSFIVQSPEELLALCGPAELFRRPNMIFQEYIPGEDWIFHGYRNAETDCFVGFTGKKLRSYPPFAGPTTLGVSILSEPLSRQTEAMLRVIGYSGVMDIDYRRDQRDGRYKLLDFNPRVGANFRMFENREGIDVVRALHLDLTGRAVHRSPMIEGRTFIVELHDLFASLTYLRRGGLTIQNWRKSLTGKRELAWWSWDDPLPCLAMGARLLLRVAARAVRTRWEHVKALLHLGERNRTPYGTAKTK
jgi:predicted ATP-grasp superfamily ATP-dependent carboligase